MHTAVQANSPLSNHIDVDLSELRFRPDYAHYQSALDAISREPLTRIMSRLVREGMTPEMARKARIGYLQFLGMIMVGITPISPSVIVDAFWHAHIIHTIEYMAFCHKHLGRFVHHTPIEHVLSSTKGSDLIGKVYEHWDLDVWGEDAICDDIPGPGDCTGR